ncbi:MAG: phosphotransferase [Scytonema sp. RU_4_4]|nr:phosphotransferase [Scytonema sp. RU_4_4]NJR73806.1 phosphotransferase [Scytonema sp. CRU_2_7]
MLNKNYLIEKQIPVSNLFPSSFSKSLIESNQKDQIVSDESIDSNRVWSNAKEIIAQIFDITVKEIELKEFFEGSFNIVFRFQAATWDYALRIRIRDSDFGFEKIAKEPFAILALQNPNSSDQNIGTTIQNLYQQKYCDFMEHPFVGKVYYSNWSKRIKTLPYTFSIYEWKEGKPLYSVPKPQYFEAAGKLLAEFHQRTFSSCYLTITDIGTKPFSLKDEILNTATQQYKTSLMNGGSETLLNELIEWINTYTCNLLPNYEAVFCHYDFSGSNIVVDEDQSAVFALDFDNWRVSVCETDFPKLFHWTIIDPLTGKRTSSPERIEDFMRGYRTGGGIINEQLLHLKEAEWLLRVYAHSLLQERTNSEKYRHSSFPSSRYYEQAIFALLQKV